MPYDVGDVGARTAADEGTCSELFAALLATSFNELELRHFVRKVDAALVAWLPGGGTPLAALASEAVALFERVGQVERALARFAGECPCQQVAIARLGRAYDEIRCTLS